MFPPSQGKFVAIGLLLFALTGATASFAELLEPAHRSSDCGCHAGCGCRRGGRCTCGASGTHMRVRCSCGKNSHDTEVPPSGPEVVLTSLPTLRLPAPTVANLGNPTLPPNRLMIREQDHPS